MILWEISREIVRRQAREFALRLISSHKMNLEEIAEMSNLPLAEVEELAKKKTA